MSEPVLFELEQQLRPLWLRAQSGDEVAYRLALSLCARRLRSYFRRRLAFNPDDVEDLVQETLLALHLKRGTYDNSVPVTAWLYAIARHKLTDQLRRLGRSGRLFESITDLSEDLHPAQDDEPMVGHDLEVLLRSLPDSQRQAIIDTKIEGLSVTESAAKQSVSESAVKVHVHRGLKRLIKLMQGKV